MGAKGIVRNSVRVAVVDDDEDMRLLVKDILQGEDDFSYAGSFSTGAEAMNGLPDMRPDLVLMDIRLPDLNGIECTRKLKQRMPELKIVMLSGFHDLVSINESIQAGAVGFLPKPITMEHCLTNLRVAVSRDIAITPSSPGSASGPRAAGAPENGARLTKREREVLEGLAKGLAYKEIADNLGVSFSTVHWHAHSVFRKLHVTNRTEAVCEWRAGLEARRATGANGSL